MEEAPNLAVRAAATLFAAMLPSLLAAQDSLPDLLQREQTIRRAQATAFLKLVERFGADDKLRDYATTPRDAARHLDASALAGLQLPPKRKGAYTDDGSFQITQLVIAIGKGYRFDDEAILKLTQMHPLLGKLATQHREAVRALKPVVDGYRKAGCVDEAFALAQLCQRLSFHDIRDSYRELSEQLARRRYEQTTKPHLTAFRGKSAKIGKSKSWKFADMTIRTPRAHAANAALISKIEPPAAFVMQADIFGVNAQNAIVLVTAWTDSKNYIGVEFDGSNLRLLSIDRGTRSVLAEGPVRPLVGQFHPLKITFADGKLTASGISDFKPVTATPPTPKRGKLRYGMLQPGLGRKPTKKDKQRTVQVRNFMIAAK